MTAEMTPKSKFRGIDSVTLTDRTVGSAGRRVGGSVSSCVMVLHSLI